MTARVKEASKRKSDALSIRIDPRLKFGLEIASRLQRRPVTGVVEWAISEALGNEFLLDEAENRFTVSQAASQLWSENEIERLLGFWFNFPQLLTYEESRLVNVLVRTPQLWAGANTSSYKNFDFESVLANWDRFLPVLLEASQRSPQRGLTDDDLTEMGLDHLVVPF